MSDVGIIGAKRTPFGRFLQALAKRSAVDLAVHAGEAALHGLPKEAVDQVILGNVLSAGQGMNAARQVALRVGLPRSTPAWTVNMMCGSGMQAVLLAVQAIQSGSAQVVLCGGTESMSQAPLLVERSRGEGAFSSDDLEDSLLKDGLLDPLSGEHMGLTAERLAEKYDISRVAQDEFAWQSQQRYEQARRDQRFAGELAPLSELTADEHPRPDTTLSQLAELTPVFRSDGTITAGNASGINDGAAMLVVASRKLAESRGWPLLAVVQAGTVIGCDPALMGLGPVHAVRRLLEQHDLDIDSFDAVEINEAFAAQTLACMKELALDPDKVNRCGGAIALGHPIGASGARLLVHLAHRIGTGAEEFSLASLCIGGGMGIAMAIRSPG